MSQRAVNEIPPVAIVTGAGSGIGQATAYRFADDGMAVACFDLKGAEVTAQAIIEKGGRALHFQGDVASSEDWARVRETVKREFGPIGVLANIAGIQLQGDSMATVPRDVIERVIQTNLVGTMIGMQTVLPDMIEQRRGKIINVSSLCAVAAYPALATYSATKGAIDALTAQVAKEYNKYDIGVNAISPGTVATNMATKEQMDNVRAILAARGDKEPATPDRPAEIISFLASPASDYLSGIVIRCGA